jgi:hypothetical protein
MVPYSAINASTDAFAGKGGYKPLFAVGLKRLSPIAMRECWHLYVEFVRGNEGTEMSFCAVECYSWGKVREVGVEETSVVPSGI